MMKKENKKKKNSKKNDNKKIIDRVVKIALIVIIILLLLHNCELMKKNGQKPNGNINIIDITCDSKKCERQVQINCLTDENNSKCLVPNFVGKTKLDVLKWLSTISNNVEIEYKFVKSNEKDGTVLEQSISGITIKEFLAGNNKLVITIADNGSLVDCLSDENNSKCLMPNFVGKRKNDVLNFLNEIGNNVKIRYVYKQSNSKAGTIIGQSPSKGKKIKDIINSGEMIVITISTGNGSSNGSSGNSSSNGSGDNGDDEQDAEDGDFIISDNDVTWSESTEIKIFEDSMYGFDGKIAPESSNTYQFVLKNSTKYNLKYKISFSEINPYNMNLKYKLKKNNTYIVSEYSYYDQLNLSEQLLNSKSNDTFYLEWKWVSEDDNADTEAGKAVANYNLTINVEAESING